MSDEMPAQLAIAQLAVHGRNFFGCFFDPVLANIAGARLICFEHRRDGKRFADRDKRDFLRLASRAPRGSFDLFAHSREVFGNRH